MGVTLKTLDILDNWTEVVIVMLKNCQGVPSSRAN